MEIRKTSLEDMAEVLEIIEYGRQLQRSQSGIVQWPDDYPGATDIHQDIEAGGSYVAYANEAEADLAAGTLLGTFFLQEEPDPYYENIAGAWLNEEPYVTIHRIASNGLAPGIGTKCIEWVMEHYDNIRIDTHKQNKPMRYIIEKLGFAYCGVIQVRDGTDRNAYHYVREEE
ncbi:GNAT family N-acetyltransferase [Suicoccus acidiformans]|uniref:GNAT family N-acetyltransferase n=1 Tax=Suicoccus acidiformans TaxID=2036206 RepID=A0A347WN29_9LACT|nr:GNAT family N-acetyltransferase [Suicoccus acidiformans]AXY26486.1 GNAT family N-acetyltransferase [Suicoccus acidiformans]